MLVKLHRVSARPSLGTFMLLLDPTQQLCCGLQRALTSLNQVVNLQPLLTSHMTPRDSSCRPLTSSQAIRGDLKFQIGLPIYGSS